VRLEKKRPSVFLTNGGAFPRRCVVDSSTWRDMDMTAIWEMHNGAALSRFVHVVIVAQDANRKSTACADKQRKQTATSHMGFETVSGPL
jgi:hypothetical protein